MTTATPTVSASAAAQIGRILAAEGRKAMLRVAILGGGCSGFKYVFDLADAAEADDLVLERDGVKVVIDPVSLPFLDGAEIDYVDSLIGSSFQVHNPNATSSCGCGSSFSI